MASLRDVPPHAWLGIAGGLAFASAGALPDERARKIARALGLAAVGVSVVVGFNEVLELLGFKTPPRIEDIRDEPIPNPTAGASFENLGDKGGIVGASIDTPTEGVNVSRSSIFGGRYSVRIKLQSSKREAVKARVRLVSNEFYAFGGNEQRVSDLGLIDIPASGSRTVDAQVDAATTGFVNPFEHPEVSLTLELDGRAVDVVRFTYS